MASEKTYIGRFAPSPTGPLHLGSLVAAVGSYLDARAQGGRWYVRMEDVDTRRALPGMADHILRTLESFGFAWDGPAWVQSQRTEVYRDALENLHRQGLIYPCYCSRKEVADRGALPAIDGSTIYPGTCRQDGALRPRGRTPAWRLRVTDEALVFTDRCCGEQAQILSRVVGDFVLQRADSLFAYQLAVVVDDAAQGITDVVRGADLLSSTPRQIWLQRCLGLPSVRYAHLPLVRTHTGEKLSKQTQAPPLNPAKQGEELVAALAFLGQDIPKGLSNSSLEVIWDWALAHWEITRVTQPETSPAECPINPAKVPTEPPGHPHQT